MNTRVESLTDRAYRIVTPSLGTKKDPASDHSNLSEGLNMAVNLLRAARGVSGFDLCQIMPDDDPCRRCQIMGVRICELVKADLQSAET